MVVVVVDWGTTVWLGRSKASSWLVVRAVACGEEGRRRRRRRMK